MIVHRAGERRSSHIAGVRSSFSADTTETIAALQVERWRVMTAPEKLELVRVMTRGVLRLEREGLRLREPTLSEKEVMRRIAARRIGEDLACRFYGASRAEG